MFKRQAIERLQQTLILPKDVKETIGSVNSIRFQQYQGKNLLYFYLQQINLKEQRRHYQFIISGHALNMQLFSDITKWIAPQITFLTELRLVKAGLEDAGIRLVVAAGWKFVKIARFDKNKITAQGIKELVKCNWKHLKLLSLNKNRINNKGVYNLCKVDWPNLKQLLLSECGIDNSCIKVLCKGLIGGLSYLDISNNFITNQCFKDFSRANVSTLNAVNIQSDHDESGLIAVFPSYIFKLPRKNKKEIPLKGKSNFLSPFYKNLLRQATVNKVEESDSDADI